MLLILTNSQDATADYLASFLEQNELPLIRLDTDCLLPGVRVGYSQSRVWLALNGSTYTPDEITHVWYRRPQALKDAALESSPEGKYTLSEWAECLEGFLAHIPVTRWMNHPTVNALASHKLEQLSRAEELGLRVPETLLTQDEEELRAFHKTCNQRIIVKPLAGGYVERSKEEVDTLIYTNRVSPEEIANLEDLVTCPTFFQQYVEKSADVRITVVDDDLHAVTLKAADPDGSQRCDIRRNNMADVRYENIELPNEIRSKLIELVRFYELRFGAIDMVIDVEGNWYFLEINPNGQWAWLDLAGATNIAFSFLASFRKVVA